MRKSQQIKTGRRQGGLGETVEGTAVRQKRQHREDQKGQV